MIGTIDIKCNAAHPNLPLNPLYTFKGSPSSVRVMDVPKKIGNWTIDKVDLQVTYPDGIIVSKECVKNGAVWVGTVEGNTTIGKSEKGFVVVASGKDENGNDVEGYVLGAGDVIVLDFDGTIEPGDTTWTIHLVDTKPENPKKGDAYFDNEILKVYDGTKWNSTGSSIVPYAENPEWASNANVAIYAVNDLLGQLITTTYAKKNDVPKKVSDLTDDVGIVHLGENDTKNQYVTLKYGSTKASLDNNGINISRDGSYNTTYLNYGYGQIIDAQSEGYLYVGNGIYFHYVGGVPTIHLGDYKVVDENLLGTTLRGYAYKSDLKNNKITIKQGGVEKGSFTLNQGTDKTIELDAGSGGGDTKCLLFIQHLGNSNQYAQWTAKGADGNNHTYKVTRSSGRICLYKDGSQVAMPNNGGTDMLIPVEGDVFVYDDGYSGDSIGLLDNEPISITWRSHNTTGHNTMSIIFADCLEQSTPISMADGTTKAVGELKVGDKVLSLNPETLQLEEDEVSDCDAGSMKMFNKMDVWKFTDGTTINTIKPHQFFNLRTNKMEYIADFQIGDGVRKQDGTTTTLFGHETKLGVFFHNTLYTKKFNNYFANGILTGNRHSVKWGWYWTDKNA